jgi:hypothetical protein
MDAVGNGMRASAASHIPEPAGMRLARAHRHTMMMPITRASLMPGVLVASPNPTRRALRHAGTKASPRIPFSVSRDRQEHWLVKSA